MDTLKHEEIKGLQEHLPIKHGGWKLLGGVIAMFVILAMTGIAFYAGLQLSEQGARASSIVFALIAVGGLVVELYFACHEETRRLLRTYWRRNVRGYVVVHYTEGGRAKRSDPFPRGHERPINVFLNSYSFVVLWPIGGWFPRPRAYWRAKQSWWSVARDTRFPGTPVRVTDKNGSSLRFAEIADAMSFIADRLERAVTEPFWHDSSDMPFSWLRVLEGLSEQRDDARRDRGLAERERKEVERCMASLIDSLCVATGIRPFDPERPLTERALDIVERVRRLIAERDAARGEVDRYKDGFLPAAVKDRDAARQERDEAVKFVDGLAKEIEQGSRLSGTIEALRLLDRMLNWLCWASVKDSPEHLALQDRLAVVRAKLAEKQRRDRRRHGKGATATT